jgi:hypothetical protein
MSDAQANPQVNAQANDQLAALETKFAVGWQKLTKQEFLEAVTIALLDKVQDLPSFQSANPTTSNIPQEQET